MWVFTELCDRIIILKYINQVERLVPKYYNTSRGMVDSDIFQKYTRELVIQNNRLLLDSRNLDYIVEIPFSESSSDKVLKVARTQFQNAIGSKHQRMSIKAVYGIVQLEVMRYLVVVTKSSVLGQVYNRKIYQVDKVEFIPLGTKTASQDTSLISSLQSLFNMKQFYYSDDYDLTRTLQGFIDNGCRMNKRNSQFFYNEIWIKQFIKAQTHQWITGFISGMVANHFLTLSQGYACEIIIISRRDKRRQGSRWICRGVDLEGNAVNSVQTQQIFYAEKGDTGQMFSFVQTRGSMPFKWQQKPDMKWSPKCSIMADGKINGPLLKTHFEDQKKAFQQITILNLVDKKGSQKMLGSQFEKLVKQLKDQKIRFVWFDFHAECKNMKYENLSKLLDIVSKQIQNYGYTHFQIKNRAISKKHSQKGVFRTNCMDCLDRTNVVQSVIARNILHKQLNIIGIQSRKGTSAFERLPQNLEDNFRTVWVKNADVISVLYSGTPAMKTDFTLIGKRTLKGTIMDGVYGVKRWMLGNFYDYDRQNSNDVLSGKLKPRINKIKKPKINMLLVLFAALIATPFIISWLIDSYYKPSVLPIISNGSHHIPNSQVIPEVQSMFLYKFIGGFLGMILIFKLFQVGSKSFLSSAALND